MSTEKIITHDDLDALRDIRELAAVRSWPKSCALLDRLIAAAEADAPSLPEGWVVRKNGGAHYHRAGELFLNADCDQRTWSREGLREELHQFTPLRPTVTESAEDDHLEAACDWSDYRRDYGVSPDPKVMRRERRAFTAGWKAGRHGDQSGVLR